MAAPERCLSFIAAVMLTGLLAACATGPQQPDPETRQQALWEAEAMAWRERRLARLTEPYGWLSLVGLEFLENGQWTLGSAPGNDLGIRLTGAAAIIFVTLGLGFFLCYNETEVLGILKRKKAEEGIDIDV